MCKICKGNDLVEVIDELNICGCGDPNSVYKLIHEVMKDILKNGVKREENAYYYFMIYQLNIMEFLDHGSSIFGSWVTYKGKLLIQALNEMKKFDYEYEDFFSANLVEIEVNTNDLYRSGTIL